jgi:hypothetical protein
MSRLKMAPKVCRLDIRKKQYALISMCTSMASTSRRKTPLRRPPAREVIGSTLQRLRVDGIALLLVEQNAMLTFEVTSHRLVLEIRRDRPGWHLRRAARQPPHPPPLPRLVNP